MRQAHLPVLLACLAIGGCASTHDPGWEGTNAQPFDAARQACQADADRAAGADREARFEACMAAHGWTRPPG